ncbi:MAG: excinuclease ABC subunit UvrA, partial [Chloroflexota bacterium]
SIETALGLGDGVVIINDVTNREEPVDHLYSEHLYCAYDGTSIPKIEPRTFSFNSPHGACSTCQGLGITKVIDPLRVVPDSTKTLEQGAIAAWPTDDKQGYYWQLLKATADHFNIPTNKPWNELNNAQQHILLQGSENSVAIEYKNREGAKRVYETKFEGIIPNLERRFRETTSDYVRDKLEEYMSNRPCATCEGSRLNEVARAVTIDSQPIHHITALSIQEALNWAIMLADDDRTPFGNREKMIAQMVLKEICDRLGFMVNVGLDYLTLGRTAGTLSGGEAQRIRLATQIGSQLMGVLYVLDEPSIGLHQRDNARLIKTLQGMRDLGNTVLVVEHDEDTMLASDWILDLGPGAGVHGGQVIAEGTPAKIKKNKKSLTGGYLSGRLRIGLPEKRREGTGKFLTITGMRENNLKNIEVKIPLGQMVCVTGVSGSGKSTFVIETLSRKLYQTFYGSREMPGAHNTIEGLEELDKVIQIDQSAIGRTPRSNPATYTGLFGPIRDLFAGLNESKMRGYKPGRFSVKVKGGRCEACEGQGVNRIEMQFLPDIYVPCEICNGSRYNRETLQVTFKGKNIADVLQMTIEEAVVFFEAHNSIRRKLQTMLDVGLGYIKLGQPATTLSGGEAQRVKLSKELSKIATGRTVYILDEPSVGLHSHDVAKLIESLNRLADRGNTVIIIEHNLDIIKVADHIIDMGPEGGDKGGQVVAYGTPEEVAKVKGSHTGKFLKEFLEG